MALLKILDLFRWIFRWAKIDYTQLRAIVAIKLTMDNRRQVAVYRRKEKSEPGNAFIMTLFFYVLFGLFVGIALFSIPSFMLSMIVFFSYIMVMVAMTLITDFSSVLLDTSDNTIILPRPVDGRTLFVARLTHILLYLGQLTAALSLIPLGVVVLKYGLAFLLMFIIGIAFSVVTAVVITNALYLLIMQFSSEEKLKNMINYVQILMAVVIMGGYQLMPRMMQQLNFKHEDFEIQWWAFLTPPVWMAGALETFQAGIFDAAHVALLGCAVVVPTAGLYLVNQYLTPVFNRKLSAMANSAEAKEQKTRIEKGSWVTAIAGRLTQSHAERGAFELIYKILGRDRKIKLKVYPTFGYIIVFGLIFIVRSTENFATTWADLPHTQLHLLLLYLTFMILQVTLYEISYSDDFKASWIYFSTPLERPGELLAGMVKAIFVRLFIPAYCVIAIVVLAIWGTVAIDDVLFGFFNNFLMLMVLAFFSKKHLPLSMAPSVRGQAGNFVRAILSFLLIAVLGIIHFLLTTRPLLLLLAIPPQLVLIYYILRHYRKTPWRSISY